MYNMLIYAMFEKVCNIHIRRYHVCIKYTHIDTHTFVALILHFFQTSPACRYLIKITSLIKI